MIKFSSSIKAIAVIVILSLTVNSCKKGSDTTTPTTVAGSASASVKVGSGTAADVSFNAATFTNNAGTIDIVATSTSGAKLTIHATGVMATGAYNFTGSNSTVFVSGGTTYTTVGSGGGNVTITTLSTDKVEGTFLVEAFAGSVYCGLSSGKFTAGK